MIKKIRLSIVGLLSVLLVNCSQSSQEANTNAPIELDNNFLPVQTVAQTTHPDIQIIETKAKDTLYKGNDGILITIITVIQPHVFATLEKPYQAIWADLIYTQDSMFSCREFEYPLFEKTTFYPATANLVQKADTLEIAFHVPFRKLATPKDSKVQFDIGFFPISFTSDPNRTESKICAPPSKKAIALYSATVDIEMPELRKFQFALQDITLNSEGKKISSYDVALGGKGLPDIYWQFWCGSELVFFSPTIKNTEQYLDRVTTPKITITDKDVVQVLILDYDNGPFNQDDIIYTWKGTYHEMKKLRVLQDKKLKGANVLIQ